VAALVLVLFAGGLVLWVGIPLGWLWVGSQVQEATDSLGAALGVMFVGVLMSIALVMTGLSWVNRRHMEARAERGLDDYGNTALEGMMALSAFAALALFAAWFFLFSGSSPVPSNLGF
jgi:hypothetical protein